MEFSRKEVGCAQQLNTSGCCFLCLETEKGNNNTEAEQHSFFSIRCLLRHLQIKSLDKQIIDGKDIQVDLCEACGNIFNGFTNVLEELEKVQMKMNYFLERINKTISDSKRNSKRVAVFSKRMTDEPKALDQLLVIDKLRKLLAVKSLKIQGGPIPRIHLERIEVEKIIQVKEEIEWTEKSNGEVDVEDVSNFEGMNIDYQDAPEFPEFVSPSRMPPPDPIPEEEEAILTKETEPGKLRNSRSVCFKKITETGMYQCKKCDKTLRTKNAIIYHYQRVHLKKRFKCDICNIATYATIFYLKVHKTSCPQTSKKRLELEKEKEKFKFICDSCGKRFRCKMGLQSHRQEVHNNINRYECNLCDKKYKKMSSLKDHKNSVHLGKVFYCRFCKVEFCFKSQVYRH